MANLMVFLPTIRMTVALSVLDPAPSNWGEVVTTSTTDYTFHSN